MDELRNKLDTYVKLATDRIRQLGKRRSRGSLSLIGNLVGQIAGTVEELEQSSELRELVRATQQMFRGDFHSAKSESYWKWHVQTVLKRSGFYTAAGAGAVPDSQELFRAYCEAFERRQCKARYLVPLEFLTFGRRALDCGSFEIRHLSSEVIDAYLGTEINRVFYTYALTDAVRLSQYWFLLVDEVDNIHPISSRHTADLSGIGNVFSSYLPPAAAVETALRVLVLFDWQLAASRHDYTPGGWTRFGLPIIIRTTDDLFRQPIGVPRLSVLDTETKYDYDGEEYEVPAVYAEVDDECCDRLQEFSCRVGEILKKFPPNHPWHFFEVAMSHLVRAFLTQGLDQLLWHTTALEALLGGGPGEPIRRTVGTRLAAILGETESEQKAIRNRFNDLYDLRCDLVHGNRLVESVPAGDLRDMRRLARGTVLWFAQWLHAIEQCHTNVPLPARAELLTALDLRGDERDRVAHLLGSLPPSFPRVPDWLG